VSAGRRAHPALAVAASTAAGLGLSLAFPPADLWPVAFVAVIPLYLLLRDVSPARGFVIGLAYGAGVFGATLYWILRFGELAWVALVVLSALSVSLVGLLAPAVIRREHPVRSAFAFAALWSVADWARGAWPFGGFTWGSVGISQVDDRLLLPLASFTGVWGITFVVIAVNGLLAETLAGGGARRRAGRVLLAAALIGAPVLIAFPVADGPEVEIAAIQVDVRVPEGTSGAEEDLIVARRHIGLHATLADPDALVGGATGSPPDLVLWGEGALDPQAAADPQIAAEVADVIGRVGVPTSVGAVVVDPDGAERTSVLVFDDDGALIDRYDKVHLVPFGEYVPFRGAIGFIGATAQIPVDRVPGEGYRTVSSPGVPPYATPICFENAFAGEFRRFVAQGASFVVVPVNNASYGFTAASDQHLQMSRMRAVETGRWVVDAAVSGVSAFIGPDGTVTARTGLFQTAILRQQVRTSDTITPYVRWGDWVCWVFLLFLMAHVLVPRARARVPRPLGPLPTVPRALVILPTYEERTTIAAVIGGVLCEPGVDIVVVDDSSPDGTADVVRGLAEGEPRIRLRLRPSKSGLASAYLEGFRVALDEGYDLTVEMDSDLSHDPGQLGSLLAAAHSHHLVVGSRYVPGGSVSNWSRFRVGLSRGGNTYARFMLGVPIHDATSGFRVYRRDLLEEVMTHPIASEGYGFQIELVMRAQLLGYDVGESPITFREREHGHSKISRRIVVEALWHVTRWGTALRLGREPLA